MSLSSNQASAKARPYWHVDAKWIFGLLLGIVLLGFLWIDTAARLTAREVAVPFMTTVVALQFSPDGLDDETDLEQVKTEWLASGQEEFRPIEGMPLALTRDQVATLPARELRLALFRQMAEPLYDQGVEGFAETISNDPQKQKEFSKDAKLLGLASNDSHSRLKSVRWLAMLLVIILAIPTIYFSAGMGRLITPGVVLVTASWAGALLFGLSRLALASTQPKEQAEPEGLAGMILKEVSMYIPSILSGWAVAFGVGIGLLAAAAGYSLLRRLRSQTSLAVKRK